MLKNAHHGVVAEDNDNFCNLCSRWCWNVQEVLTGCQIFKLPLFSSSELSGQLCNVFLLPVSSILTSPCLRIQSVFFSSKLLLDAPCSSLYNGVQDIFFPRGKLQFLRLFWCRTSKWRKWSGSIRKFLNAIIPMPCHSFGAYFKTTKPFLHVHFIHIFAPG